MRLVLIRHGKSDWHNDLEDFARPLNKRGKKDAHHMAEQLLSLNIKADVVLSSSAERALSTAKIMSETLGFTQIKEKDDLYLAPASHIIDDALTVLEPSNTVFIFGHNPGISMAASQFVNKSIDMKPCSLLIIDLDKQGDQYMTTDFTFLTP